ncbi:unnamed protein product [Adineta steineri]|uniref:Ankyrin repeat protein n=1 Tax=Adineta steineri TaxID=433720 RepID=A0A813T466_9BILA|nr:unnamed protein product [Adineta steineri]
MFETILTHASFKNKNLTILLGSALTSNVVSFRRALHDFKMIHKKIFSQEINQLDKHHYTFLWYLAQAGLYNSIYELYQYASIDLNINIKNGSLNQTILHYVVINGNLEDIRIVLDIHVDTNLNDQFGRTAIHYIALYDTKHKNDIEIIKLLIEYGAIPNLEDNMCQTCLHHAIIKEKYDLVEYLISLSNINMYIRDKYGYTPICYLCENILKLSDISFDNNQCENNIERILKILNLIVDRCPSDELSSNFHIIKNDKLNENLLLHVYHKFTNLSISFHTNILFTRLESIIIGTNQDHCLLTEQLLKSHSWESSVNALCNTHHVNISNALIQCIAHDPHILLSSNISPFSDLSMFFVLIFYALASDIKLLQNIVPICDSLIFKNTKNTCYFYIDNFDLHTTYTTFIHSCLHYANFNVFSLKHLCRYHIRYYLKSNIINKIDRYSNLKLKYCNYLKLNELSDIFFKTHNLAYIIYLIKRLYNIHQVKEYNLFENDINIINDKSSPMNIVTISSIIDTLSNKNTIEYLSESNETIENDDEIESEDVKSVHYRTIEEIMAESDISSDNVVESKHSLELFKTNSIQNIKHKSILSDLDDEISIEEFENELADVNNKSKYIEDMIDKFLLEK